MGEPTIKAIETRYKDHRFRSRLEARWAVFFDSLDLKYEYEKEGFHTPSGLYLPDFWLPRLKTWVEIKGRAPTDAEQDSLSYVATNTASRGVCLWGSIEWYAHEGDAPSSWDGGYLLDGGWDNFYRFCQCARCKTIGIQFSGAANRNCFCVKGDGGDSGHDLPWPGGANSSNSPPIERAYAAALSARFEHGEHGAPVIAKTQMEPPDADLMARWRGIAALREIGHVEDANRMDMEFRTSIAKAIITGPREKIEGIRAFLRFTHGRP